MTRSEAITNWWANKTPEQRFAHVQKQWRAISAEQRRLRMEELNKKRKRKQFDHGVANKYWQGCRCLPCSAAAADYESRRRAANRPAKKRSGPAPDPEFDILAQKLEIAPVYARKLGRKRCYAMLAKRHLAKPTVNHQRKGPQSSKTSSEDAALVERLVRLASLRRMA